MVIKLYTHLRSELNRLRNPFTTFEATGHNVKAFPLFSKASEPSMFLIHYQLDFLHLLSISFTNTYKICQLKSESTLTK